jgi:hypothetical protein
MTDDNFIVVPTRDEKKKQRKLEKQKPQFQFDVSWFRMGKKVGIAVGCFHRGCECVSGAEVVAYPGYAAIHCRRASEAELDHS